MRLLWGFMGLLAAGCSGGMDGPPGGTGMGGAEPGMKPFAGGVTVRLERVFDGGSAISFGLPLGPGLVADVSAVRVTVQGRDIGAAVRELLAEHDKGGARVGARAMVIELPASVMTGRELDVDVSWKGDGAAPAVAAAAWEDVSVASPDEVETTVRTIQTTGGVNLLVDGAHVKKTLFTGREPRVLARYPKGYLAATGILGQQVSDTEAMAPARAGLGYLSKAMRDFGLSAMYAEGYALNDDPESVVDPVENYEGWLYDRCATFLTAFAHTDDPRFLRHALRSCGYYARQIDADGIFTGKPEADIKYSHLRGLYAYFAMTGDPEALRAGRAMAGMWLSDTTFVEPYRNGHVRGPESLWTERLLGTSLEGLYYGYRLTGETTYLTAFKEMLDTAYRHITGDAAALAQINPGASFPPQNCFIHNAAQQSEGEVSEPWCSIWMSELSLDVLLHYQAQTGDDRVDEIFIRLARYLRDVGAASFTANPVDDTFLSPLVCDNPADENDRRRLVPLYGSGLDAARRRQNFGDYNDFEHCTDATGLTAVALRALKRRGTYDQNPIGPFSSEGESFLQLHHEFSSCAERVFAEETRPRRDPAAWTSQQLAAGRTNPAAFIKENKIGFPLHQIAPLRKLGWWFNMSMLQFALLRDAGIDIVALRPGQIQPASCP